MNLRNRIAHAATPWDWRSRRAVEVLVGAMALCGVVTFAGVVTQADDTSSAALFVSLAFRGCLWYLIGMRPALRSLHRWDRVHRSPGGRLNVHRA